MAKSAKNFKKHMMYSKSGEGKMANTYEEHLELKKKGWGHSKPKRGISRLKRGFLGKPSYFIGGLIQGIKGKKEAKEQIKKSEAEYKANLAKEEQVKKDRQQLTMGSEALKMKEGMAGGQVQAEQENIDKKIAAATAAATRGGTRVSAFEAAGAGDQAQADLSRRMESAKRAGLSKAMEERTNLRGIEEDRSKTDLARAAMRSDQAREDIKEGQRSKAAYESQMYSGIDAGISMIASDEKKKKNIKKVGESEDGVPISEFDYKDSDDAPKGSGRYRGVIAQDLIGTEHEDAVGKIGKNTLGVNYGKLDVKLGRIKKGKLKDKIKGRRKTSIVREYNEGGAPKDMMEAGEPEVSPGKFSHETNPIDLIQRDKAGNTEKIGEMTGGEAIVPPKNVTQIRKMIQDGDGDSLVSLMDRLLTKWDKEADETLEARKEWEKTHHAKKGANIIRLPFGKGSTSFRRRTRNSIFD